MGWAEEKLECLMNMLDGLVIEVRNDGKGGGILNEGVGADYVQKEKVVPQEFGSNDVGMSLSGVLVWMEMLIGSCIS